MSTRAIGLQMALERRSRDEAQQFYYDAARADALSKQRAVFEVRTQNHFQAAELKRRAKKHQEESAKALDARRSELSSLLSSENEQYQAEIHRNIETPQTRRLRLMDQLKTLQQKRQDEHDGFVKEKTEQGWRDSCDPLRHQISEALEKKVIAERDQQVKERDLARSMEDADEVKYTQDVKKSTQEFYDRIAQEKEEKQMKIQRNSKVWIAQMEEKKKAEEEEKHKEYLESLEFRTTLEAAKKKAEEAAHLKAEHQAARRKELDELNKDQISRKKSEIEKEKALDVEFAKKAKEEMRQEEEDALVTRLIAQRKTDINRELLATQLDRKKAADDESEMFIRRAQKEAEQKEDATRKKDEEQRKQLMFDSVAGRVEAIKAHEEQKKEQKKDKIKEREQMLEKEAETANLEREEGDIKKMRILNQYDMLQQQSQLKASIEQKRKKDEQDSVRQMIEGWNKEEDRIKEALANPHLFIGNRFHGHR